MYFKVKLKSYHFYSLKITYFFIPVTSLCTLKNLLFMPSPSAGSGGGQASRGEMSRAKCKNSVAVTQSPTRRKYKLSTVFLLPRTKSLVITFLKQTCVLPFFGQIQYYTVLHTVSHAVLVRLYVLCEMLESNPKLSASWYETAGQIIYRGACALFHYFFCFQF